MPKNKSKIHGYFDIRIYRNGQLIDEELNIPNLVVNGGLAQLALLAGDASAVPFTYIAVGVSNVAVAAAQTALGNEITTGGLGRAAATVSRVTTSVTNDTLQLLKVFTSSATHAVEEVGVFNASSGVTMLCRALSSKSLLSGDELSITYKVSFADDGV